MEHGQSAVIEFHRLGGREWILRSLRQVVKYSSSGLGSLSNPKHVAPAGSGRWWERLLTMPEELEERSPKVFFSQKLRNVFS